MFLGQISLRFSIEFLLTEKFQHKYRIPSIRLQTWDYRWPGAYFITICTHNRAHYFGEVIGGQMQLSQIGVIADIMWHEIKCHTSNVALDAFVVMPDHIHGILILKNDDSVAGTLRAPSLPETLHATALPQTLHAKSLRDVPPIGDVPITGDAFHPESGPVPIKNKQMANISPKAGSVSAIIRSYKSSVTRHAHRLGFGFQWQERFWDRVIRSEREFIMTQAYIMANPKKWNPPSKDRPG